MLEDIFHIISKHHEGFISGLFVTFKIAVSVWVIGIIIGGIIGILATKLKVIDIISQFISFFVSGIPILVFLFWLHYPAQSYLGISVDPFITVVLMLSILNTLSISEIVKNGINNIPRQYLEVAKICGVSFQKQLFKIEFPLFFRHILPSLLMSQVNILHMTLFASLISVEEIFRVSQRIISIEYKPIEIYTALGIFFLIISLPINGLAIYLKKHYSRDMSEK